MHLAHMFVSHVFSPSHEQPFVMISCHVTLVIMSMSVHLHVRFMFMSMLMLMFTSHRVLMSCHVSCRVLHAYIMRHVVSLMHVHDHIDVMLVLMWWEWAGPITRLHTLCVNSHVDADVRMCVC